MSATSIIRSKPDGTFVEVFPDGREVPWAPPETAWTALDAMTDEDIRAGIAADPDTRELTGEDFARLRPARSRGRPRRDSHKLPTTIRLDPEVVDFFKKDGAGWQSRINEALRKVAGL